MIGFGFFIIGFRDAWASKIVESKKMIGLKLKKTKVNEYNYAKNITKFAGIWFVAAGIIMLLNVFIRSHISIH